jgi:hypothetical protein
MRETTVGPTTGGQLQISGHSVVRATATKCTKVVLDLAPLSNFTLVHDIIRPQQVHNL